MKTVELTYRYDETPETRRPRPASAEAARLRLDEGSRTIASLLAEAASGEGVARRTAHIDPRDIGVVQPKDSAPIQRPFAAVLGCSDARVPIELVFNEGPNDLFVVRVAGNGLGAEGLGSLKYAADHLGKGLKLVVVLGHSGCGAVSAAVDVFLDPKSYLELADKHTLRNILDRLLVVVHAAAKRITATYGADVAGSARYRNVLIEAAVALNAALAAYTLQCELGGTGANDLRAAYGVWLLESHEIWAPRYDSRECTGLAYPPADATSFLEFGDAIVRSERIAALIAPQAK